MTEKESIVIGAGFAGLSAACFLAAAGRRVTVLEKHATAGGRARKFETNGFTFDMGPSWYWMPDVFERFFASFGANINDYYTLTRLNPAFRMVFDGGLSVDVPGNAEDMPALFESIEPGAAAKLEQFMRGAQFKYEIGMRDLVYKPGLSWKEFLDADLFKGVLRLGVFQSYARHVRRYFRDERLIRLMEFPVLFLGGTPETIPALYSLMAYGGFMLGTWYPEGGMYAVVEGMTKLAGELGVQFQYQTAVSSIEVENGAVRGVGSSSGFQRCDELIAAADYHHVEQHLLPAAYRKHDEAYWQERILAPSAVIFYLGINRRVPNLLHHTLFFDAPYAVHADALYKEPALPEEPLFYVCAPSVTDHAVAPQGSENLFVLVPVSTELQDTEEMRRQCFERVMNRLETYIGVPLREHISFKRSYAVKDFTQDYHALRGNAYGLANTLRQTALLKPSVRNPNINNLVYAGQLTVPGPGVPPALISGEIAAGLLTGRGRKHRINKISGYAASAI